MITFHRDHYQEFADPRLDVVLEHDAVGAPYFVLSGPEPDYAWETFIDELQDVVAEQRNRGHAGTRRGSDGRAAHPASRHHHARNAP